ncbi:glycine cleavage system aminomethyltransferase GcvT [Conexibacter sp. CPCC 206217]|uniref:glycine cleavage system aminomethyltransferase GcvT n=1 Tax=Conexibacter sp. CPCC 206217 TaxID=3064574 RepID=UPI00271FF9CC|nr:glycine cleavage system aminomethyltransferase GcvT [Conexibacter sp. CPCC 206217]MDO8210215.1 glycine cleavage system aminomethyltransferase GcvT [Conexibacter sp. CPCC 206217]
MRSTPLNAIHRDAGAKLVSFAGWEMPVQYPAGIKAEHLSVRDAVGVFDVSHMGEVETRGPGALRFLQRILSNDVEKIAVGGAQYSVLCKEDGGVLDDLFTYRLGEDRYLTVTNADNHEKDFAWFVKQARAFDDVEVVDRAADYAMLAVQGPRARGLVQRLLAGGEALPARFRTAELTVAGVPALVCGTGYTGEDGVELLLAPADAPAVWDAVTAAGAAPVGLAARDTLRLEVCFHLYGNDLMESRGPIEAGLGWCCKEQTGFIGCDAVAAVRAAGPSELLAPFVFTGPGIPRQGNAVVGGGEVTSGTLSPSLEIGIGMAYLPLQRAVPGTEIEVDVRGKTRAAVVKEKPIYRTKEG